MYDQMTTLTAFSFEKVQQADLSAEQATEVLLHQIHLRCFSEKLAHFYHGDDLRATLTQGLMTNHPDQKRETIDRRVREWLNGSSQPTKRQDYIELCFVLSLSLCEADALLAMTTEEGVHWRDPNEIIIVFALKHHMSYHDAQQLYANIFSTSFLETISTEPTQDSYTPNVQKEVLAIADENELKQFIRQSQKRLGKRHNSAYRQFMEFIRILECSEITDTLNPEKKYTTRQIVEIYLDKKIPKKRKDITFSTIQQDLRANWPDETSICRMKSREIDVTRKVLILLFLVTDGGENTDEWMDEEEEKTSEERFRSSYCRMNQMLEGCGFSMLDPRSAFDWLALYCLRVDDVLLKDEKMQLLLDSVFNTKKSNN